MAIQHQGGGPAFVAGVQNFISQVLQMPDGVYQQYIQINRWTSRLEIVLPRNHWNHEFEKSWSIKPLAPQQPSTPAVDGPSNPATATQNTLTAPQQRLKKRAK